MLESALKKEIILLNKLWKQAIDKKEIFWTNSTLYKKNIYTLTYEKKVKKNPSNLSTVHVVSIVSYNTFRTETLA